MIKTITPSARVFLMTLLSLLAVTVPFFAHADDSNTHLQIKNIIASTYDKPGHKVETAPIASIDEYAIADWTQGNRGGRALLRRTNGKWGIMACGADGLKETKNLTAAGIPQKTAESLVSKLNSAEKSVKPDRLKMFSLYGTKDDPMHTGHHHHSKP